MEKKICADGPVDAGGGDDLSSREVPSPVEELTLAAEEEGCGGETVSTDVADWDSAEGRVSTAGFSSLCEGLFLREGRV